MVEATRKKNRTINYDIWKDFKHVIKKQMQVLLITTTL